jgi:hypothetical protein
VVAQGGTFIGSATAALLGNLSGAGTVYLRPNGYVSTVGQLTVNSSGNVDGYGTAAFGTGVATAQIICGQTYSTVGANCGWAVVQTSTQANTRSSANVATAATHALFYNPNGQIGSIGTSGSATSFNTSSDERLKTFTGLLSGDDAIAIIRADPARRFTWNVDGTEAVGWGAQTSYEVSHDLASPPPPSEVLFLRSVPEGTPPPSEEEIAKAEPGDSDFVPWGMDQSKRTPYLWAALAAALDKIDALEARLAALEASG